MSNQSWEHLTSVLVDTGIFIHWFRGDRDAQRFFHDPGRRIYYAKVTRKELLREPIRTSDSHIRGDSHQSIPQSFSSYQSG